MKKRNRLNICLLIVAGLIFVFITSCKKEDSSIDDNLVKDIDGNVYHTVTIGTQVWMVEELKTTRYNDGTAIPLVTDKKSWSNLTTPGYCWYQNDQSTYGSTYGALYKLVCCKYRKLVSQWLACSYQRRMENTGGYG
jgi:hypothetical protein